MNTAVNMGWCYRSSVYVVTSGGVNTAECELQLFFQGVDVNEVTALYHSTFNVTGRAMRNGEVRPIASVCEREIVGGLQFVRKLHFPLSPSSSFPPDYPLYLTNLVIHPLSAVLSGLHNSFHPTIRDGSTWSKFRAHGEQMIQKSLEGFWRRKTGLHLLMFE